MTLVANEVTAFGPAEILAAVESWGCNCGPTALAFFANRSLDQVHAAIEKFDERRYTSPSMMSDALRRLDIHKRTVDDVNFETMFDAKKALVRIQWGGPWTAPGVNPKAACCHAHWVCTFIERLATAPRRVFDINCGVLDFADWKISIIPRLLPARSNGRWWPTHVWRSEAA